MTCSSHMMAMKGYTRLLHISIFLAVATLTAILECDARMVTGMLCSYFYRPSKNGCILCTDRCRPGEGFVRNCGYDEYGKKVKAACAPCKDGYFSPRKSIFNFNGPSLPCRPCRKCFPPSRTKRRCSPTRNAKCSSCPPGMYKHGDGRCYKCSYCCGDMIAKRINVVSRCENRGNGRCVCRETTNCYDNVNHNIQCPAYRRKTRFKSIIFKRS